MFKKIIFLLISLLIFSCDNSGSTNKAFDLGKAQAELLMLKEKEKEYAKIDKDIEDSVTRSTLEAVNTGAINYQEDNSDEMTQLNSNENKSEILKTLRTDFASYSEFLERVKDLKKKIKDLGDEIEKHLKK